MSGLIPTRVVVQLTPFINLGGATQPSRRGIALGKYGKRVDSYIHHASKAGMRNGAPGPLAVRRWLRVNRSNGRR